MRAVCEHIHLPLQSGSSRILKAMRRTYDRDRYLRLVAKLRDAIPGLALGTDIIVGFPGETEDEFRETLAVVEDVRYDSAFTFIYFRRQGTEAAALPDQVPDEVKHDRLERLVEVVQRIAAEQNIARVGTVEEVLVEGGSRTDATLRGRTRGNLTVNFAGDAEPGELVDVLIESATSTTLRGAQRTRRSRHESPAHGLVGPDRHQPRAATSRRRPRGLRRRPAREHVDGRFPLPDPGPLRQYGLPRRDRRRPVSETDVVVHLAAHAKVHQLVAHPHRALENTMMTFNVLEYCRQRRLPLVFSSTRGLRRRAPLRGLREDTADFAFTESPYSASKIASEAFIYAVRALLRAHVPRLPLLERLRPLRQRPARMSRVLPLFIHSMSRDEPITVFGGADKVLDFTYIDDCVDGSRADRGLVEGRVTNETINLAFGEGNTRSSAQRS